MGIDLDNIIDRTNVEHFICSICTQLLENAVIIPACEHMFCKECISNWAHADLGTNYEMDLDRRGLSILATCPDCRISFTKNDLKAPVRKR